MVEDGRGHVAVFQPEPSHHQPREERQQIKRVGTENEVRKGKKGRSTGDRESRVEGSNEQRLDPAPEKDLLGKGRDKP